MKITKERGAGEYPSPAYHRRVAAEIRTVLAVSGAGTALWRGSAVLITRGWNRLGEHLTGWEKWGTLAATGYAVAYAAARYPNITRFAVPLTLVGWCVAAWWVAPPSPRRASTTEAAASEDPTDAVTLDGLAEVVRRVAGTRQGAHLADLLQQPEFEGRQQPDLKAAITRLDVPVQEFKLILDGRQRVRDGVRLRDLPAPATSDPAPAAPPGGPGAATPRPDPTPTPAPE
ncbi:hypothetical protein [Streptomyces sp. NPDC017941]|uniref:hypothetical protein n=1 Tax=Streptomyces sp. NPDC017941 TaxID=3365018 RepID=UPI0037896F80